MLDWFFGGITKYETGGSLAKEHSPEKKMLIADVMKLKEYATKLSDIIHDKDNVEAWVISKIAKVEQTTANVKHALEAQYPDKFEHGGNIGEHEDGEIVRMMLLHVGKYATKMLDALEKSDIELDAWMTHELAIAGGMIDSVFHYMDYFTAHSKLQRGGAVGKSYHLMAYTEEAGKDMLYAQPDLSEDIVGNLEGAINRAKGMMADNASIKEVKIIRIGKTVLQNKKVAHIFENGTIERYEDGGSVEHLSAPNTLLEQTIELKVKGGTLKTKDYTHFALLKSDKKIVDGWDYSSLYDKNEKKYDTPSIVEYTKIDLEDRFPHKKYSDFIILARKTLEKRGIKPSDTNNWYKHPVLKDGGSLEGDWIVYNPETMEVVGDKKHKSYKAAMKVAKDLLDSEKYNEVGVMTYKRWSDENIFARGGHIPFSKKLKVGKVMHEFKHGTLMSHGRKVTDRKQAIAIALSSAGLSNKYEEGGMIENFKLPESDEYPVANCGIPDYNTALDRWALYYDNIV